VARVKTLAHRDTGRHDSILPKGVGGRDLYLDCFAHTHDPEILRLATRDRLLVADLRVTPDDS
jgi:hypothetical protein